MSGSATPDFDPDGVADIFSAATGTLTVWNSEGGNKFGQAAAPPARHTTAGSCRGRV
jgi:hypothetical protein